MKRILAPLARNGSTVALVFTLYCRRTFSTNSSSTALTAQEEEDFLVQQLIQQTDLDNFPKRSDVAATSLPPEPDLHSAGPAAAAFPHQSNPSTDVQDERIKASRFVTLRRSSAGLIEWMCMKCASYNAMYRHSCKKCGSTSINSQRISQPNPARHVPLFPETWYCNVGSCRNMNTSSPSSSSSSLSTSASSRKKYFCSACYHPFGGVQVWTCPYCNVENSRGASQCAQCFLLRPAAWKCPECRESRNSIFSTTCASCRHTRLTKKSVDAVNSPTTRCKSCNELNSAQWEICYSCMAPLDNLLETLKIPAHSKHNVALSSPALPSPEGIVPAIDSPGPSSTTTTTPATKEIEYVLDTRLKETVQRYSIKEHQQSSPSWVCFRCKLTHRAKAPFCDNCLMSRESSQKSENEAAAAALLVPVPEGGTNISSQRLSWICEHCAARHPIGEQPSQANDESERAIYKCSKCQSISEAPAIADFSEMAAAVDLAVGKRATRTGAWHCDTCNNGEPNNPLDIRCKCGAGRKIPFNYWQCSMCLSINRNERLVCIGCTSPASTSFSSTRLIFSKQTSESWSCKACGCDNSFESLKCENCSETRCNWKCSCGETNTLDRKSCKKCNALRVDLTRCPACASMCDQQASECPKCGTTIEDVVWKCLACGFDQNNFFHDESCQKCKSNKVDLHSLVVWICDTCKDKNIASSSETMASRCSRCSSLRKSAAHMSAYWKCTCGQVCTAAIPKCSSCGGKRKMKWHLDVACPSCHKHTDVDTSETCTHCKSDLSDALSDLTQNVVLAGTIVGNVPNGETEKATATSRAVPAGREVGENTREEGHDDDRLMQMLIAEKVVMHPSSGLSPKKTAFADTSDAKSSMTVKSTKLKKKSVGSGREKGKKGKWSCSLCLTMNDAELVNCANCGIPQDV